MWCYCEDPQPAEMAGFFSLETDVQIFVVCVTMLCYDDLAQEMVVWNRS